MNSKNKEKDIREIEVKNVEENPCKKKVVCFEITKNRRTFKCPHTGCGRAFKEKGNLRTHIRIHTGERPFVCKFEGCGKSFITLGNLKSHTLNHTGEKLYKCSWEGCGKAYSRVCRLRIHQRTHTGNKPFPCPHPNCGKLFNEKGNLKTHYRIHTGEKPFKCTFEGCEQAFKAHGHLKDHMKRHLNLRPYECGICKMTFARSSTLKIHLYTHTGENFPLPLGILNYTGNTTGLNNQKKTHPLIIKNYHSLQNIQIKDNVKDWRIESSNEVEKEEQKKEEKPNISGSASQKEGQIPLQNLKNDTTTTSNPLLSGNIFQNSPELNSLSLNFSSYLTSKDSNLKTPNANTNLPCIDANHPNYVQIMNYLNMYLSKQPDANSNLALLTLSNSLNIPLDTLLSLKMNYINYMNLINASSQLATFNLLSQMNTQSFLPFLLNKAGNISSNTK